MRRVTSNPIAPTARQSSWAWRWQSRRSLAKQGKMTETIAQLQEATRLAPEFADAFHNLAGALDRVGRLEEAIAAARRSVRLEPRNAQYHRTLARLLQQHGDMEEAAEQLRKAERLRSRNP